MKILEEREFETKYNEDEWEITVLEDNRLYFRRKGSDDEAKIFFISPDEIVEQVSDHEFITISNNTKRDEEEREMVVLNFDVPEDEDVDVHYQRFTHCYALSDDLLLFKNERCEQEGCYAVYSISEGGNLREFDWISKGYDIDAIKVSNDDNSERIFLHVTKTITSDKSNDYVQFAVDPVSFQPISEVHSTLRDKYIKVQSRKDVETIIEEDSQYKEIVDSYALEVNNYSRDIAKEKLLSKIG